MKESQVFGFHVVEVLLGRSPERVLRILLDRERRDRRVHHIRDLAAAQGLAVEPTTSAALDRLAGDGRHQGVVAVVRATAEADLNSLLRLVDAKGSPALLLALDGVQDPRNLGACLRTAEAAGADAVMLPRHGAAGLTAVARKAASGAAELLPVARVGNLVQALGRLRDAGLWIVGAADDASGRYDEYDWTTPTVTVLGAEGGGLRRLTRERCDWLVRIPMAGGVPSLNVSVAAGVLLYEAVRQREHT